MAYKSRQRIELEKYKMETLLVKYTMTEISQMFGCSYSVVNRVAEQQFSLLEINKFEENKEVVKFLGTKGAWAELKSTPLYKQIMNGR